MKKILIIEDDYGLRNELRELLEEYDFTVYEAGCGKDALAMLKNNQLDLCLLDVGLPDCYGTDLCQKIREFSYVPIIFLTGCDDDEHIVNAFQLGADDYITKPFKINILMSRISAQLRRLDWDAPQELDHNENVCYKSGDLMINPSLRKIYRNSKELSIRPMEYDIFEILFQNYGRIVTRSMILEILWDSKNNYVADNTLSVNISRLRKQLGSYKDDDYIKTSKRQGYFWAITIKTL